MFFRLLAVPTNYLNNFATNNTTNRDLAQYLPIESAHDEAKPIHKDFIGRDVYTAVICSSSICGLEIDPILCL